jgi:hypothetical protein
MKLQLFYSWQSDTDEQLNRYFVQGALKMAVQNLEYEIEVDEATRGVPGSPSITASS